MNLRDNFPRVGFATTKVNEYNNLLAEEERGMRDLSSSFECGDYPTIFCETGRDKKITQVFSIFL